MSLQEMKEQGMTGRESKDKITVDKGLHKRVQYLNDLSTCICDGSSSANKSFRDIVVASKKFHPDLLIANCFWHKAKTLTKDYNSKLLDKFQPKKKGQKRTLMYPELREMGATGRKAKSHWYRSQKVCHNDPEEMEEEFCSFIDHYIDLNPQDTSSGWNGVSLQTKKL